MSTHERAHSVNVQCEHTTEHTSAGRPSSAGTVCRRVRWPGEQARLLSDSSLRRGAAPRHTGGCRTHRHWGPQLSAETTCHDPSPRTMSWRGTTTSQLAGPSGCWLGMLLQTTANWFPVPVASVWTGKHILGSSCRSCVTPRAGACTCDVASLTHGACPRGSAFPQPCIPQD